MTNSPPVTENDVIAIVREAADVPDDVSIDRGTNFIVDLDIDSLTLIQIDALLQAKLGVALAADDIADVETIGDLIDAIAERGQRVDD